MTDEELDREYLRAFREWRRPRLPEGFPRARREAAVRRLARGAPDYLSWKRVWAWVYRGLD